MTFDYPPRYGGDGEAYTRELQGFLWQLCERLNVAMNALDSGTFSDTSSARKGAPVITPGGGGITPETKQAYEELKALIANTAEYSKREINAANETATEHWNSFQAYSQRADQATTQLEYGIGRIDESMSEQFGYYGEQVTNLKTRSDMLEEQQLTFDSLLVAQDARMAGFDTYRMTTEGFIRQGFIAQGAGEPPIIGIAIGQNATTSVSRTIDGVTYYEANTEEAIAFYTAQKVSFYLHGIEVAYISNENLYINSANIINDVTVGDFKFASSPTTGLSIKWTGA